MASRTRWDPRLRSQVSDKSWLVTSAQLNPVDVQRLVLASMFVLVSMFYVAMAFASLQLRMTKKILKAIELAAKA